jgi:hypothetical protein
MLQKVIQSLQLGWSKGRNKQRCDGNVETELKDGERVVDLARNRDQ